MAQTKPKAKKQHAEGGDAPEAAASGGGAFDGGDRGSGGSLRRGRGGRARGRGRGTGRGGASSGGDSWMRKRVWVWCDENGNPRVPVQVQTGPGKPRRAPDRTHCSWTAALPKLRIRTEAANHIHPAAKPGRRTKPWPFDEPEDPFAEFHAWCVEYKQAEEYLAQRWSRSVARFWHLVAREGDAEESPLDRSPDLWPEMTTALYIQGLHMRAFKTLDILRPGLTWSSQVLIGMKLFCEYISDLCHRRDIAARGQSDNQWPTYIETITMLLKDLSGPIETQIKKAQAVRQKERGRIDEQRIKEFPPVEKMKSAVHRAMVSLQAIGRRADATKSLGKAQHVAATVAMVGIIAFNGFMGRGSEYCAATKDHVLEQLKKGLDYIVVSEHKTQKAYGDIAKWFAPGTVKAIECYLRLPRKKSSHYFLFVGKQDVRVNVAKALKAFVQAYLTGSFVTILLLRKWFHSELMRLARDQEAVIQLFTRIDKHSAQIARKHYVLVSVEDDVGLAKEITMTMLGETVPWPTDSHGDDTVKAIMEMSDGVELQVDEEADEGAIDEHDEEILDWWPLGACFGLAPPMVALADAPQGVMVPQLEDASATAARASTSLTSDGQADGGVNAEQPRRRGRKQKAKATDQTHEQSQAVGGAVEEDSASKRKRKACALVGEGASVKSKIIDARPKVRHSTRENFRAFARRWFQGVCWLSAR